MVTRPTGPEHPADSRTHRLLIAGVALVHSALFIAYQRPDWNTQWKDQSGYLTLGRAIAETGRFTRFPGTATYVPEAIRTPLYPAFVALVDLAFGEHHMAIACAQAVLVAMTCLLVYGIGREVTSERLAFAAGLVTALYPPLPYYAALVLTETLTTWLVTAAVLVWLRALRRRTVTAFVASGLLFAAAALTRPSFQFLPVFMAGAALAPHAAPVRPWRGALVMLLVFVAAAAPWIGYNAIYFHELTFSPAGGPGRQVFEGFWQTELPGRVEAELTTVADEISDRAALDARARAIAGTSQLPADLAVRYVHQHADIQRIWSTPDDPNERMRARIVADREYLRVGLDDIRRDPAGYLWGRATRGALLLWASEIPVRYSEINRLSPLAIRLIWLPQVLMVLLAGIGVVFLVRMGARDAAYALAAVMLYVTAFHVPIYSEARYSLPAKPIELLLVVVAIAGLAHRLPPSQSQT